MRLSVLLFQISLLQNLIYASSSSESKSKKSSRRALKKTEIGFLDDLSSTQSFSGSEAGDHTQLIKPKPLEQLETIQEEPNVDGDNLDEENELKEVDQLASDTEEDIRPVEPVVKKSSVSSSPSNNGPGISSSSSNKSGKPNPKGPKGPSEEDRMIDDKLTFLVSYYDIYEHLGCPTSPFRHIIFIIILTFILVLLFYLMYSISSDYLTPSLAHLSLACRMSSDMAGLTFLAFGNGAPDLFTALLGAEDAPEMILGSSIGSGLFIFTVVFGLVIIFARDPLIPQSSSTAMILSFPSPKDGNSRVKIGRGTFWRNALMYAGCVGALAWFTFKLEIPMWQPFLLIVIFFIYLFASIGVHYFLPNSKKNLKSNNEFEEKVENGMMAESQDPVSGSMQLLEIERRRYKIQQLSLFNQFKFAFYEITEWNKIGWFLKSFWILTCPLRLILNLTILPLPDPTLIEESPDKVLAHWFISRFLIVLNPFGSVALLAWVSGAGNVLAKHAGFHWLIFSYFAVTSFLCLMFHLGSSSISNPLAGSDKNWKTSWPLWIATVYSFTCCIAWIFAVSNELVAALSSLGLILGVSRSVMGCLVLAWGNSIGDLIADVALARNGAPQTAITAIFSGPVQNVLLTIGISFMAAASQSPDKLIKLSALRGDLHLSLALLAMVICSCLVLIPGYFKYRIPRQFGVALILLYIVYVPFSLWLGLSH